MSADVPNRFEAWWRHFSQTGDICPLRLGMSRDELRDVLGDPHETGGTSRKHKRPLIWWYAGIEFHFGHPPEDGLRLIYSDNEDGVVQLCISRHAPAVDGGSEP